MLFRSWEVTINYPQDTLPRIASIDYLPMHGVTAIFAIGLASFYVYPSNLSYNTDSHPSPTLNVGLQLTANPSFPFWVPSFEQVVSVPFGDVKLRFEYTYQPLTGIGTRSYYVNDTLQRSVTGAGFFFTPTGGTNCVSACGTLIQLASYEPWDLRFSGPTGPYPLWAWNGYK